MDQGKGFDSQQLWCDIHQRYGHSTDWCYDNPHRTGGKPPLWCELCNRSGHTANSCYATSIRISPKGKGSPPSKGSKGKGHHGNRGWKSQKFPANYHSEQATPALHDEPPSNTTQEWWDSHELGSVAMDHIQPTFFLDDADDNEVADYIDLVILAIITNMDRQTTYLRNPSIPLRREIIEHDMFITTAENCTNVHIQRIIRSFKTSIRYDATIANGNITENQATNEINTHKHGITLAQGTALETESAQDVETAITQQGHDSLTELQRDKESPTEFQRDKDSLTDI
jgi:hypothetical protein